MNKQLTLFDEDQETMNIVVTILNNCYMFYEYMNQLEERNYFKDKGYKKYFIKECNELMKGNGYCREQLKNKIEEERRKK